LDGQKKVPNGMQQLESRKFAFEHADEIFADHKAGMSKDALIKKYNLTSYYIDGALFLRGVPAAKGNIYKDWNPAVISAKRHPRGLIPDAAIAEQHHKRTVGSVTDWQPKLPPLRDIKGEEPEESVIIMKYETTQLKQLRAKIADNERLTADNQMAWAEVERLAPYEKKCTELEKKYNELLQTVKENIASRVAADESLAHKG
jgi:hypothetical protein